MRALRLLGGLAAGALGLLLVLGALALAVSAGWQRERLARTLERAGSGALDAPLRIEAIEGPLYPWLALRGVEAEGASGRVRVERLRIDIGQLDLSARHLGIDELRLVGLQAELRRTGTPDEPPSDPDPAARPLLLPLSIAIERIRVEPARVRLTDAGEDPDLRLSGELELEADHVVIERTPSLESILAGLQARASVRDLVGALGDVELADAGLRASWSRGKWSLEQAHALLGPGRLEAHGSGDLERIDALRVEGRQLDLAALGPLLPDVPLAGSASIALDVAGPLDAPAGSARIEARALRVREVEIGDVGLQVASSDGTRFELTALEADSRGLQLGSVGHASVERLADGVRVTGLELRAGAQQLDVDGSIHGDRVSQLRLRAAELDLALLGALAGVDGLSGRFSGTAQLDGPLPLPQGGVRGRLDDARVRGVRIARLDLDATLHAERASLRLQAREPAATLELDLPVAALGQPASAWRDPGVRVRLDTDALDAAELASLLGGPTARGLLDAHLELRGGEPWPALHGALDVRALEIDAAGLPGAVDAALAFAGQTLRIDELVVTGGAEPAQISGELTLAGTPARPRVQIERLDIDGPARARLAEPAELVLVGGGARFERLVIASDAGSLELAGQISARRVDDLHVVSHGLDPGRIAGRDDLGGRIDADLRLDGALPIPHASGTLVWHEPRWGEARLDRLDARLQSDTAAFRLDLNAQRDGREALSAQLQAPVRVSELADLMTHPDARAQVRASGFDLAWLAPLLPRSWRPSGALDADVKLRGAPGGPVPEGELRLEGARFHVALLRQDVGPVRARIVVEPDRLRFAPLRVPARRGSLELTGSLGIPWTTGPRADLVAALDGFEVRRPGLLQTRVHGELKLEGPLDAPRLRGDVELREMLVQLPEGDDRLAREIRVIGLDDDVTREDASRSGARASWDVTVRVPRGTWVRGLGANVEIEGELQASSEAGAPPRYAGAMRIVRGTYRLEGRSFDIQQGVAAFTGSTELDPQIHLVALRRVRDVTIIAVLSGWSSDPQLELQSEPPLPRDDLLAYLIFGRPTDQVGGQNDRALAAVAGEMAGRIAMERFSGLLLERLPIDTIELDAGGEAGPSLGVGKYVRDDVFVRYRQTIEGEEVEVEWQVTPDVSVQSEISSEGAGGADLIWSRDY